MIEWFREEDKKPEYNTPVLVWFDCKKCRKGDEHMHQCVAADWNFPNSFQRGSYCKGMKGDHFEDRYPKEILEDHWCPMKPSHWAYVNKPIFED